MSPHSEYESLATERDRWLGQEIFRLSLAKEFMKLLPGNIPPSKYDNLFANVLDCYQYRSACQDPGICGETFPSDYPAEKSKYQEVLFTYIGSTSRKGLDKELQDVLARLHKYVPFSHDWKGSESGQDPVGPTERVLAPVSQLWEQPDQDVISLPDRQLDEIARYTTLLHEQGQMICAMPVYDEYRQSARSGLPWFSTTVRFRGVEGHGSGPTKKIAKHTASKDACDKLGISHRIGPVDF